MRIHRNVGLLPTSTSTNSRVPKSEITIRTASGKILTKMDRSEGRADIVVIGSCMIDMLCYAPRIPLPGETLHGTSFGMCNGGKGANQCVVAAKLGAQTALVAALGNDVFGKKFYSDLQSLGVNVDHVQLRDDAHSGVGQITVTEDGQNCIITIGGSNKLLSFDDIKKADEVLSGAKVVLFELEVSMEAILQSLAYLKNKGNCITVVNAAPVVSNLPSEIFRLCQVFCVNEVEASQYAGFEVTDFESAKKAAEHFKSLGCNTVIITMGEKGIVYCRNNECLHLPVRKITPVDSTGAGDAFVGALAFYMAKYPNLPFRKQVERSAYIATESVLKKGTQSSYPGREQLPDVLFE